MAVRSSGQGRCVACAAIVLEEPLAPAVAEPRKIVLDERSSGCSQCGQELSSFFLDVNCGCRESRRFGHCLCLTGATFAIPAALLLRQRSFLVGTLAAALTATTITYHATHRPRVRATDVLTLWLTAVVGIVQAIVGIVTRGVNAYLVLALVTLALCQAVNLAPFTHDQKERKLILLPWHVALHGLCTASLTLLALGWGDRGWI